MKITVLGPGKMGSALARTWSAKGHDVTVSLFRDEERIRQLLTGSPIVIESNVGLAVAGAEAVMISCQYQALDEIYRYDSVLAGKPVITCVSGLSPDFTGATIGIHTARKVSIAEEIQDRLSESFVVEAFNVAFSGNIDQETKDFGGVRASIFYCGDRSGAKDVAAFLIRECEYDPVNAGTLISARTLETLATAWVQFTVASGLYPRIGMKALRR